MNLDLTGLVADAVADNPTRVRDLANLAARHGDGVPYVLLPVRLETRFVEEEEPIAAPVPLARLTEALTTASGALHEIAVTDLATQRAATVKLQRERKREVEDPLYAKVEAGMAAARAALATADTTMRSTLDGDESAVQAALAAVAAVRSDARGAGHSLERLRSPYHRERLQSELAELAARAERTLAVAQRRVIPAVRLRGELAVPDAPERLLRSARAAVAGREVTLAHADLAAGAETFEAVLAGVAAAAGDPARAEKLAGAATTIPLIPETWKRTLARAVEDARRRAPSGRLDALAEAVAKIPSDAMLGPGGARPDLTVTVAPATRLVDRLLVRIYPDDIAVDTHEEALTDAEREAGEGFWRQMGAAGPSEPAQRAAWRALCVGRGSRRAAWIARVMEPEEPRPTPGAAAAARILAALTTFERRADEVAASPPGQRFEALVRAAEGLVKPLSTTRPIPPWAIESARRRYQVVRAACERLDAESRRPPAKTDAATRDARADLGRALRKLDLRMGRLRPEPLPELEFPDPGPLKEGAWTRAAGSGVLPRRFLVVAVKDGRAAHVVAGARVPSTLKLGLDPDPAVPANERFSLEDGELVVGESIRWMVDYREAVASGMAVTLDITAEEARGGFDRVYVLGLQTGRARDGAARLEGLLDNHHYGSTGLALVPVGTPTNNTEGAAAGYSSSDDVDAAFDVELRDPPFSQAAAVSAGSPDGLRLARALGVNARALAHVQGATGRDAAESLQVNAALYPATLNAWLEENAAPLISRDSRDRLRAFALAHVSGRGLLPAFRAGGQPYGVLPVTARRGFVADPAEAVAPGAAAAEVTAQARFDRVLTATLDELAADWAAIREKRVVYATDPDLTDARSAFLEILGLEPVSSASGYRFAVNVGGRRGPAAHDPALEFGILPQDGEETESGARFGPFALLTRFESVLRDAFGVAPGAKILDEATGGVSADFAGVYDRLSSSRAYELRLLDRGHRMHGPAVGADPAAELAQLAATGPAALAAQTAEKESKRPLLNLLLRQSLLLEWREAALRMLVKGGLLTEEGRIAAGASTNYVVSTFTSARSLTRWSYLLSPLGTLNHLQGIDFGSRPLYARVGGADAVLAEVLPGYRAAQPGDTDSGPLVAAAERHAAAVAALGSIPRERLEPLLFEHLDLAGHRLDAWITGLAQRRLAAMRAKVPFGAHVGAYGWVDDLVPDPLRDLAPGVPPALNGDPSKPIHLDDRSQGFVQAPSPDHAVTAAMLRSGYLSQRSEDDVENRMAVNLTSRRTRLALGLIDGVRAGNRLGALLGYRLERFLHEYHAEAGISLDALIGPLRQSYPSVADVDGGLSPDAAARQVCDGLEIVEAVQAWLTTPAGRAASAPGRTLYETMIAASSGERWGLDPAVIPPTGDPRRDGLLRAIDHIADALDSLGDLIVAEAVHQLARGNHERAAATLSALGEGKAPPRPEVVDTPRSGTPLTHRILLGLPAAPAGSPAGWEAVPMTPRAMAEPALNAWAAALIGPPQEVRMRIVRAADGADAFDLGLADLGLQPLDLVAVIGPGFETGLGEIAARALDAVRPSMLDDLAPPPRLQVDLGRAPAWDSQVRSLAETAPLIEAMAALAGRARPATARDYVPAEQGEPGAGDGVDSAELLARVSASLAAAEAAAIGLARLLAADPSLDATALREPQAFLDAHRTTPVPVWARREDWRAALLPVAAFGVAAALPPAVHLSHEQVLRDLRTAAETGYLELSQRIARASAKLTGAPSDAAVSEAARELFGEGFQIVPIAPPRDTAALDAALAAGLAGPAELEGWLHGAGAVREAARGLADLVALADAHGGNPPQAGVAQLPHVPGEAWLGASLAGAGSAAGRLSLVVFGPEAVPGAALHVDEWTEVVPAAEETTGVAVHYDQPDATAPQCVLVAVPPRRRGAWRLGELMQTLHDTFELARSRTVEPDHLQAGLYGQLLPAISGEIVPDASPTRKPAPDRVILDFGAVN